MTIKFVFERETKSKYRFTEVPAKGKEPVIGTLYVSKLVFSEQPEAVQVELS